MYLILKYLRTYFKTMNEKNMNRKNISIKIFVDNLESILIKEKLNLYNCFSEKNKNIKKKSLSEFLREIILKSLLNLDDENSYDKFNLKNELEDLKKILKRNVRLTYKILEEKIGNEEAEKFVIEIKKTEE